MTREQLKDNELDRIIRHALIADNRLTLPEALSERTIRRLHKRALLRQLVLELFLKVGIALVSVISLAAVFAIINGCTVINQILAKFLTNWQLIFYFLLLIFVTLIIDQVGLKFYSSFENEAR
jgi:hypothetical protein